MFLKKQRRVTPLACFATSSRLAVCINPRIDHQSHTVPVQSAPCLISARAEPKNKQLYHRRILHTRERQRDTKQTNKCASPHEEFWAA